MIVLTIIAEILQKITDIFGFGFGFGILYSALFNGPLGRGNRRVGPGPLGLCSHRGKCFASDRLTQRG